jgi:hypothetical protein
MSSKRTKRRRSTLWREIHDQAKREEIVKRLVGKVIDSALNGIVVGAFALWTFLPAGFFGDSFQKSVHVTQVQVLRAVAANRLIAKTVIKPTRQVSKLFVRT